jgi:hypothetical protein
LWFSALALAVAGPLLGGGYLLLLDYPAGPEFPHVPLLPLPSSGDVGNGTPFLAIQALLRGIHPYLPDKVLLVAPIVLGGVGVYRIVRTRFGVGSAAAAYGGTLYVFNPFIAERYLAGHMFILLALGLLPWALGSVLDLLDDPFGGTSVQVGAWLFGLAAVDLHVAGFYALLVVVAGAAALSRRGAIRARADRQTATAAAAPGGRCRAERGTQGRREGSSWVPDDAALGLDGEPGRDSSVPGLWPTPEDPRC